MRVKFANALSQVFFLQCLRVTICKTVIFTKPMERRSQKQAIVEFGLKNYLFPDEKKVLEECDERVAVNVSWTIECSYLLAWVLGLISTEEMEAPCNLPDGSHGLFKFVQPFHDFEDFKASCNLRQSSEIMDMFDLYYNYHWACVDNRLNPDTNCGELNEEVVMERRKALEWLICKDKNWDSDFIRYIVHFIKRKLKSALVTCTSIALKMAVYLPNIISA